MRILLVALLCGIAIAMSPRPANAQETVAELKKRVAELEAQIAALKKTPPVTLLAGWNKLEAGMTKGAVTVALGKFQDDLQIDCHHGERTYRCSRWVLPDGGVVEFQRHPEFNARQIVRRWRLPGCGGWLP